MNEHDIARQIELVRRIFDDPTFVELTLPVSTAWALGVALDVVAHHIKGISSPTAEFIMGIKDCLNRAVATRHDEALLSEMSPDAVDRILDDGTLILVRLTFKQLWNIVTSIQFFIGLTSIPWYVREPQIELAQSLQRCIVSHYAHAQGILNRGWPTAYRL